MPLLATAEKIIIAEVNVENNLDLKVEDVVFGVPAIPTSDEDLAKANGHNAMVRIQALATANAIGATTVYYDRVDFADMFTDPDGIQPLRVPARLDAVYQMPSVAKSPSKTTAPSPGVGAGATTMRLAPPKSVELAVRHSGQARWCPVAPITVTA